MVNKLFIFNILCKIKTYFPESFMPYKYLFLPLLLFIGCRGNDSYQPQATPSDEQEQVRNERNDERQDSKPKRRKNRREAGNFDYYVMALSWSPDYCNQNGDRDTQQCGVGRQLGFVLHGLWPQFTRGYPQNCSQVPLSAAVQTQFSGLYPSEKLFEHEWEKHGTCSGLSPEDYLNLSKKLKDGLRLPSAYQRPAQPFRTTIDDLQSAFSQSNNGFSGDSFAPNCSGGGRFLKELFVCYDKDGKPTACSREVLSRSEKSCGQPDFLVRSVR
jgi:ribonuclease T2